MCHLVQLSAYMCIKEGNTMHTYSKMSIILSLLLLRLIYMPYIPFLCSSRQLLLFSFLRQPVAIVIKFARNGQRSKFELWPDKTRPLIGC